MIKRPCQSAAVAAEDDPADVRHVDAACAGRGRSHKTQSLQNDKYRLRVRFRETAMPKFFFGHFRLTRSDGSIE
jgi:hypothetical protein